jgi:hypothetical protein
MNYTGVLSNISANTGYTADRIQGVQLLIILNAVLLGLILWRAW